MLAHVDFDQEHCQDDVADNLVSVVEPVSDVDVSVWKVSQGDVYCT